MELVISRDENIRTSSVYIGFLILKALKRKKNKKISIFEIVFELKKELAIIHDRQIIFSLMFLYSLGIIDFSEAYIYSL